MKKQQKTYLLLTLVLGIWAVIGYKFFSAANPSQPEFAEVTRDHIFVPTQIKEKEIFTIDADYRDPFLGTVYAPKKTIKKAKSATAKKQQTLPSKQIEYTGFITDKGSQQKIFFVTVDGQQQMMSLKDTFQEVKLVSGTKNSIKVRYDGISQNIALNQ